MSRPGPLLAALGLAVTLSLPGEVTAAEPAGPWRGQVVDAETGQPLEGVVVLAVWDKLSPGVIHRARDFYDVDEVVTDAEGRFALPARILHPPNPFVQIDGPHLLMFKGGYGLWQFRPAWKHQQGLTSFQAAIKRFGETEAVFELPPLKTRKERLQFSPYPSALVPNSRIPRFREAIRQERIFLGLQP